MLDGEEKLIQDAVKEGDSSAFGKLYDYYQPMIYRFVIVKVGRREEAEDITHQVFLQAWQNVRTYHHRGHPFGSWLYQIARNQVIDHYRSRRNDVPLEIADTEGALRQVNQPDISLRMDVKKVLMAIRHLKSEYQDAIVFRFIEDLSIKETADVMHKTEGAIKLIQHRAIEELKRAMHINDEGQK